VKLLISLLLVLAFTATAAKKHTKAIPSPIDPSQKVRVFVGESEAFFGQLLRGCLSK